MTTAVDKARAPRRRQEVVCVSHQLPVWTLRLHVTGQRLWHDPRRRECGLCSMTSAGVRGRPAGRRRVPASRRRSLSRLATGDGRGRADDPRCRLLLPAATRSPRAAPSNSSLPAARPTSSTTRRRAAATPVRCPARTWRTRPTRCRWTIDLRRPGRRHQLWGQWCGPCRAEVAAAAGLRRHPRRRRRLSGHRRARQQPAGGAGLRRTTGT